MKIWRSLVCTPIAMCALAASTSAQSLAEGDFLVRHFRFHAGDTLSELRLHYTTIGAARGQAVLLLHGTGGSAAEFLGDDVARQLYVQGQPLDTSRYFIIIPDAIGHGKSSKPSDGLRTRFPRYDYEDMVDAQYRLLTEHLGITHLRLVLGGSMGGMLTWLWGARYPHYMDVIVPLASEPASMGGRNWMMRRMVLDAIRADPDWHDGNYTTQPTTWRKSLVWFSIATNGGSRSLYRHFPTSALADSEVNRRLARTVNRDANDALYQFDASRDYDPTPSLAKITARVVAINSVDDERNPPELGVIEKAIAALPHGEYVLLPLTEDSEGHSTTDKVGLWKCYLARALEVQRRPNRRCAVALGR